jgi:hypothetical protein
MRADRGAQGLPDWPDWCFLPLSGWYGIVSLQAGEERLHPGQLSGDVGRLGALGAWRPTQGVYRFHPEVLAALAATPLSGDMPADVLLRLPEWCIYVETPGVRWYDDELYGFFAHLEHDTNDGRAELRLLLDSAHGLVPMPLHLGPWSLDEAMRRVGVEVERLGLRPPPAAELARVARELRPLVGLVLYLCSEGPEVRGQRQARDTQRPQPVRTKRGWRLFPPPAPRLWAVGQALGEAIRQGREAGADAGPTGRKGPRPHIRRAHWHGYWTGPQGAQRLVIRWLAPIPVALVQDEDARDDGA